MVYIVHTGTHGNSNTAAVFGCWLCGFGFSVLGIRSDIGLYMYGVFGVLGSVRLLDLNKNGFNKRLINGR